MNAAPLIVLRHLWVLRRNRPWQLIVNGVFEPFLYLVSIGVGIGQLVTCPRGRAARHDLRGLRRAGPARHRRR